MSGRCKDLPDECWEMIFMKMGRHSNLQNLILVCKRFFSIIKLLRTSFSLNFPAIFTYGKNLSFLFNQFPNIKSIILQNAKDSDRKLLDQIFTSSLIIQSLDISGCSYLFLKPFEVVGENMKSLRVLSCSKMIGLSDDKLAIITNNLPWVEELDISYPEPLFNGGKSVEETNVTDNGIEMISSKMKLLKKINISGNHFITDKSLIALSRNCGVLEQVEVSNCALITVVGIQYLVRYIPNLTSLTVSQIDFESETESLDMLTMDCFSYAIHLSKLDIEESSVSDKFLNSLSQSNIPLKSFRLARCDGFSCDGITFLLKRYHSLDYLMLTDVTFAYRTFVCEESLNCFSKLSTINLQSCNVGLSTFLMLAKSCPLLENIDMENTMMGQQVYMSDIVSNPRIKSLSLSCNPNMSDECLAVIVSACPFLEILDVSFCSRVTEKGLSSVFNRCLSIKHLEINGCEGIENFGDGIELPKLEVLRAKNTRINDEGLYLIGKRCCELLILNLMGCLGVTRKGLKDMLEHCRKLRELNLKHCFRVSAEIMDWMVFTRPSLRKIIPPNSSFPDVCQMQLYLRHGCYVGTQLLDEE